MIPIATRLYLASRSPRRQALLRQVGIDFELLLLRETPPRGPEVDELPVAGETPAAYVQRVCRDKARAAATMMRERALAPGPVLAADTTVCIDGELLGKPADAADAARMLGLLSGKSHRVLTAVALLLGERLDATISESTVRFCTLDKADIEAYVASGEPFDKAGAYAIQGRAAAFVAELHGSYSGVMGLPLHETVALLRKAGVA